MFPLFIILSDDLCPVYLGFDNSYSQPDAQNLPLAMGSIYHTQISRFYENGVETFIQEAKVECAFCTNADAFQMLYTVALILSKGAHVTTSKCPRTYQT
jgi:hypothetical protein